MSEAISSLTPANLPVQRPAPGSPEADQPDVPEISFRELWSDKAAGFGFADLLDIVNPLQHLPVIGTLYRGLTGDGIGLGARLAGGTLYGGPLGMLGAVMMAAADQAVGGEPGAQVIAFVRGMFGDEPDSAAVQVAAVAPAAGPAAAPADGAAADLTDADFAADTAAPARTGAETAPAAAPVPAPPAAAAAAADLARPRPAAFVAPAARLREFPAHPGPRPVGRGLPAPVRTGLGAQRSAPVPPVPVPSPPSPGPAAQAPGDAESRRILAEVQATRRMQAGLLLASLAGSAPSLPSVGGGTASPNGAAPSDTDPAAAHPFLPPTGASPMWVGRAMEEALAKYRKSQILRRPAPDAPGRVPPTPP
jgi:hypothetical protein